MGYLRPPDLFQSRVDEARYEEGRFILPEEEEDEEDKEEDQTGESEEEEYSYWRKLLAKIHARAITGLLALLQTIFKIINFLLTALSKLI